MRLMGALTGCKRSGRTMGKERLAHLPPEQPTSPFLSVECRLSDGASMSHLPLGQMSTPVPVHAPEPFTPDVPSGFLM